MKRYLSHLSFLIIILTLTLLTSCAKVKPESEPVALLPMKTITVLPVQIFNEGNRSSLPKARQLQAGADVLDSLLEEYLMSLNSDIAFQIIPEQQMESLFGDFHGDIISQARYISNQLGGDAALALTVKRYIEREGTTYSVVTPASVSFEYKLVTTQSSQTICSGVFEETQADLFSNLFSLKKASNRGFKWISAEDLAREGLNIKLQGCPYLK